MSLLPPPSKEGEDEKPGKKRAVDLFDKFDLLFSHKKVSNPPHPFVLNKFLASDPDMAVAAKEIISFTWDPDFTWEIWRAMVPRLPSAPRMRYPTAKKDTLRLSPLEERVMLVEGVGREEVQLMIDLCGEEELEAYYGVESEEESENTPG